jgi:hypothetical protein
VHRRHEIAVTGRVYKPRSAPLLFLYTSLGNTLKNDIFFFYVVALDLSQSIYVMSREDGKSGQHLSMSKTRFLI